MHLKHKKIELEETLKHLRKHDSTAIAKKEYEERLQKIDKTIQELGSDEAHLLDFDAILRSPTSNVALIEASDVRNIRKSTLEPRKGKEDPEQAQALIHKMNEEKRIRDKKKKDKMKAQEDQLLYEKKQRELQE